VTGARGKAHIRADTPRPESTPQVQPGASPPQELYGAWRDTFPPDFDLDAALQEVRDHWRQDHAA
jgi:hypothetical protein